MSEKLVDEDFVSGEEAQLDIVAGPECPEMFTTEFMEQIEEAKRNHVGPFQSYWEADENDIHDWTKKEIALDPIKRFISSAENGKLDEIKHIVEDISKSI